MHDVQRSLPDVRERLIRSERGWWFLGKNGYALLRSDQVSTDGMLRPSAERRLRRAGLYDIRGYKSYALTVLTTTDCNLGCAYCFQNIGQDETGGNRPPRIKHARLTSETIGSIIDFTRRQMAAVEIDRLSLLLFGGEPLLNLRGARELLTRAADLSLSTASMTSNGVLLTPPVARELNAAGLTSVQITFDGDHSEHDAIRVRRSGGGTFDTIVTNIARATESTSLHWQFRVNVSHHNLHGIDALVDRLSDRLDPSRCSIYFAMVGDVGVGYENSLARGTDLAEDFSRWYARALDRGFTVSRPKARTSCQSCGFKDGRYGAVVSADGTLSSCWDTAGMPEWRVGTITDGYLPGSITENRWVSCDHLYRQNEDATARTAFTDKVDAALLDQLSARGRI